MAIQSQPSRIPEPFAGSGTKNTIPATNATPSASQAASWASGFPPECSQPISAGGCPVPRNDVNGALNHLSQDFAFRQDGGIWEWSALADYDAQRMVRGSDGLLYWSIQPSGPGIAAGAQDPTADAAHAYWASPQVPTLPAGDNSKNAVNSEWVSLWYANLEIPDALYLDEVNGDDSNSGFSAQEPKKTISGIETLLSSTGRLKPSEVSVYVAPGTYAELVRGVFGVSIIYIFQSGSVINGVQVNGSGKTVRIVGDVTFIDGFLWAQNNAYVVVGDVGVATAITFDRTGKSATPAMIRAQGGTINMEYYAQSINFNFISVNVSTGTVFSQYGGRISFDRDGGTALTFSGSVTGRRYSGYVLSYIIGVGGANVIPGTIAGTVDSTSFFA